MEIRPILSALLRNRAGAILVALQIAITLAIVVNARVRHAATRGAHRPPDAASTTRTSSRSGSPSYEKDYDFLGMVNADMALLRQMPGIVDATPMSQMPLSGSGSSTQFYSLPDEEGREVAGQLLT